MWPEVMDRPLRADETGRPTLRTGLRRALAATAMAALAVTAGLVVSACASQRPSGTRDAAAAGGDASRASPGVGPVRAHPQAVEPTAGISAASGGAEAPTPVGDPQAHAPSLAEVKRELSILNRCGGATSSAFAQPVVKATGPGFTPDPGTSQTQGQLPILTARLDALGKALGVTIYGISGYRTPAHSVAVGGFANDPHTRGQAEDIGVGSLLRSSAAQISEAQLAQYGLYRPFDPSNDPNNSEVNHIQLIPASGAQSLAQATTSWSPDPRCH
jgi:Peptidase M15